MCLWRQFGIFGSEHRHYWLYPGFIPHFQNELQNKKPPLKAASCFSRFVWQEEKGADGSDAAQSKIIYGNSTCTSALDHHPYPAPQGPLCHRLPCSNQIWHGTELTKPQGSYKVQSEGYLGKEGLTRHQLKERSKKRTPEHRISPDSLGSIPCLDKSQPLRLSRIWRLSPVTGSINVNINLAAPINMEIIKLIFHMQPVKYIPLYSYKKSAQNAV